MIKSPFFDFHSGIKKFLLWALFPLMLSGCAGWVRPEQASVSASIPLSADQTVGQTFVARYDGLSGIYFYLSPSAGSGMIRLHLRSNPQAKSDLALSVNSLSQNEVTSPGYYGFYIPPQNSSNQQYYYAFLEFTGSGSIQVGKSAGDTYLNGALYQGGGPQDAQAAFKLSYSRRSAIIGLVVEAMTWAGFLIVGLFLFVLPGWGLFSLLWPGWSRVSWPEKLGLSAGISLAIYPLLLLWTDLIGLHLGALYAWLPPLAGLGMLVWKNRKNLNNVWPKPSHIFKLKKPGLPSTSNLVFLIILALIVFSRFWVIRSLDLPMWGDSYQHTMIAQLIVDHGGLFTSWLPYAEMTTFTYHFGFHSAVAVFDWITGMNMPNATLWVGQLLNILAVIVLYPLAMKIGSSRWSGIVAVTLAGLLVPMPMFYINWGRYTQLAGQVILPVVAVLMWDIFNPNSISSEKSPTLDSSPQPRRVSTGRLIPGCLALGGLALTHYRILILAMVLLLVFWILYARRGSFRSIFIHTLWLGLGAGLLFLPWFIRVFGGRIFQIFAAQISVSAVKAIETDPQLTNIGNLSPYLSPFLWLVLVIIIGIGLWHKNKNVLVIILWWIGNFLIANPWLLGLPGSGLVTGFTVMIAIYIPAALLTGVATGWIVNNGIFKHVFHSRNRFAFSLLAVLLFSGAGLLGVRHRIAEVRPSFYSLATRPDVLAASWLKQNTSPEARILINSFPAFGNSVIVGSDGGWWLPLLAHRLTTVPPLNYGFEKDPWPGYAVQINAITFEIESAGIQDQKVLADLKDRNISYIYIGQLQGKVNSSGSLFTSIQLLADPNFQLIYHQDRVWIFQIQ
jgi:hypothetical protein